MGRRLERKEAEGFDRYQFTKVIKIQAKRSRLYPEDSADILKDNRKVSQSGSIPESLSQTRLEAMRVV